MRLKVKNKKKFLFWCIVLIVTLNFAFNKDSGDDIAVDTDIKTPVSTKYVAVDMDKKGNISFIENEYFKKYTIECNKNMEQIKWEESKDFVEIYFNKNDIPSVGIKGDKHKNEDIYHETIDDELVLKIKKKYNNKNDVYIENNNKNNIIVLIAKKEDPIHSTIVLDAGHGGIDKGTNYKNIYEKDLTLKIANYAAEELKFNGFKVVQTRNEDKLLALDEVAGIANRASADLFVSFHINSNEESEYKGVSTYYYHGNGYQKEERTKLANIIQKELVKSDNWQDRGTQIDNLKILRLSKVPCVLLELGFLSNPQDREKLSKDEVLRNFAINATNGVKNYLSIE